MNVEQSSGWPVAEINPVQRLQVLASAIPGFVISERLIPVRLETVWDIVSDLERELPQLGGTYLTSLAVSDRQGESIRAIVKGRFGLKDAFAITLRPGWCWMEGRFLIAAMAAAEEDGSTRFAWAAQLRLPGNRLIRPFSKRALDRTLQRLETRVLRDEQPSVGPDTYRQDHQRSKGTS